VEIVSERAKRHVALAQAQQKFAKFIEHIPRDGRSKYWGSVQLPYFPFYAFEEIPAVFGDLPDEELALLTPIKQIARAISDNVSLDLPAFHNDGKEAERLRTEVLGWYLRKATGPGTDPAHVIETLYEQLSEGDRVAMKDLLLRLVQVGEGSVLTAATVSLADYPTSFASLARTLSDAGVLQILGQEVLVDNWRVIEGWPPLRQ
jgi:hypothetical protein